MADDRIIARQRERIEELEEEVRQLKESLEPKRVFPAGWKLQPAHHRLLSAMLDAPGGYVPLDRAHKLISRAEIGADINTVRVRIYAMRKILAPMGVQILARWGMGYELTPESKAIIKRALDERLAA